MSSFTAVPFQQKNTLVLACSYLIFPLAQYSICHTEHLFHWPVCSSQTRHNFYFTYLKVLKKNFVFLKIYFQHRTKPCSIQEAYGLCIIRSTEYCYFGYKGNEVCSLGTVSSFLQRAVKFHTFKRGMPLQ